MRWKYLPQSLSAKIFYNWLPYRTYDFYKFNISREYDYFNEKQNRFRFLLKYDIAFSDVQKQDTYLVSLDK